MIRLSTWKDGLAWKKEAEHWEEETGHWKGEAEQLTERVKNLGSKLKSVTNNHQSLSRQAQTFRPQISELETERDKFRRWWHDERQTTHRLKTEVSELREALQIEMAKTVPQPGPISPQPPGVHLPLAFPEQFGSEKRLSASRALTFLNTLDET